MIYFLSVFIIICVIFNTNNTESGYGHKAFLWAWLDKYGDEEVRIAVQTISYWENPALLLELEAIILRATEPPYNVRSSK